MDQALQDFSDRILAANADRRPLCLRGSGSKDWYGQAVQGDVLDTRAYDGIVAYEPTELVITVRCGTTIREVEAALAEKQQMLAFEPSHYGEHATIGGMVAAGLSGPRRQNAGAVRDFMLGAVLMNGKREVLHFGGQVMKNVAGYDVSRLLAGSLGTLGLILEVSLKVLPQPFAATTLRFELPQEAAIRQLNEWGGQPLPISASVWHDDELIIRLSGSQAGVQSAQQKLGGEVMDDAPDFWRAIREQTHAFFDADAPLWRLSLPSITPPLAFPGAQLIEWGGAQRWLMTTADATEIRAAASKAGGHATLFKGGDKSVGVFHPLAAPLMRIHRQLKTEFDPAGIFNPGRMYPEF
jgi:glycolate oxidase FAD binding subunit